jgi:hypothetical protein
MERRLVLVTSVIAFVLVVATDVLYIGLVDAQGQSPQPYIPRFVGSYLALAAALIAVALLPRPEIAVIRIPLRAAAGGGLLVLGALTAIGLPLVIAGILVTVALSRTAREPRTRAARLSGLIAAAISILVLLVGLEVTPRLIVCPDQGTSAGGGSGLLTGSYSYECSNGELHFHS